jgi:hypothetical protein
LTCTPKKVHATNNAASCTVFDTQPCILPQV